MGAVLLMTRISQPHGISLLSSASSPYLIIMFLGKEGRRRWSDQCLLAQRILSGPDIVPHTVSCLLGGVPPLLADATSHDQDEIKDLPDQPSLTPSIQSATELRGWTVGRVPV